MKSLRSKSPFRKSKRHASALIVILWAVTLLAFAVAIASEKIALILGDTSIQAKRFQAELLADSALASVESILKEEQHQRLFSKDTKKVERRYLDLTYFQGTWQSQSVEFGGGTFQVELMDELSKINWLQTPPYVWRNLFDAAGVSSDTVNAWQDALKDWQDANDDQSLNGAETADYQAMKENKRRAKNTPVTDMGELFWVKGGPEIMKLQIIVDTEGKMKPLLPMTTIYGSGQINLNTAPAVLIAAALGISLESAEQTVRSRWGPDGKEGTEDDVFLQGVPVGTTMASSTSQGNTINNTASSSSVVTLSTALFRARGIGEFQGQRVVREALAVRDSGSGLRLLQEPRTVESRPIRGEHL